MNEIGKTGRERAWSVLVLLVVAVMEVFGVTWLVAGDASAHPYATFVVWLVLLFVCLPLMVTAGVVIGETDPDRTDGTDGGERDA